ncbi:hypothetical protein Ccrd_015225, partial [Cynara cardunculus var. scolymus]
MHYERRGGRCLPLCLQFFFCPKSNVLTLEMVRKEAPRGLLHLLTLLNPQPSQLRFRLATLRHTSNFGLYHTLIPFQIWQRTCSLYIWSRFILNNSQQRSKLLFASSNTKKHKECEVVKTNIHHRIQGDMVLECIHMDEVNDEMIFRLNVTHNIDNIDVLRDVNDQIYANFKGEV